MPARWSTAGRLSSPDAADGSGPATPRRRAPHLLHPAFGGAATPTTPLSGSGRLSGAPREHFPDADPERARQNVLATSPSIDPRLSAFFSDSGPAGLCRASASDVASRAGRRRARRAQPAVSLTESGQQQEQEEEDSPAAYPVMSADWGGGPQPEPHPAPRRLSDKLARQTLSGHVLSTPDLRPPVVPDSRTRRRLFSPAGGRPAPPDLDAILERAVRRRHARMLTATSSSSEPGADRCPDTPEPEPEPPAVRRRRHSGSSSDVSATRSSASSERSSRSGGGEQRETLSSRHQRLRARQRSAGRSIRPPSPDALSPEPDPDRDRQPPRTISGRLWRQSEAVSSPDLWRPHQHTPSPLPGDHSSSAGSQPAASERSTADPRPSVHMFTRRRHRPRPPLPPEQDSAAVPSADAASARDFPVSRRREIASPWSRLSPAGETPRRPRLPDVLADLSAPPTVWSLLNDGEVAAEDVAAAADAPVPLQRRRSSLTPLHYSAAATQAADVAVSTPSLPVPAARGCSVPRQFRPGARPEARDSRDTGGHRRAVSQSGSPDRVSVASTGSERARERGRSRSPRHRIAQLRLRPRRVSQSPDTRPHSVGAPTSRSMTDVRCVTSPSQEDVWHSVLRAAGVHSAAEPPPLPPPPPPRNKRRLNVDSAGRRRVDENRNQIVGCGGSAGSGSGSCTSCGGAARRASAPPAETVVVQLADISGFLQRQATGPGSLTDASSVDLELEELEPQPELEPELASYRGPQELGRQPSAVKHNLIEFASGREEPAAEEPAAAAAAAAVTPAVGEECGGSGGSWLQEQNLQLQNLLLKRDLTIKNLRQTVATLTENSTKWKRAADMHASALCGLSAQAERRVVPLEQQLRALTSERDEARDEVANIETMFADLHRKYERCKSELGQQRRLCDQQVTAQRELSELLSREKARYDLLQTDAEQAHERLRTENLQLTMKLRLAENKMVKLEDDNRQLTAMCDELIQKMGAVR